MSAPTLPHPLRRSTDTPRHVMNETLLKIAIGIGAALAGWTGQSLTLGGRVDAIERSLVRIEARLEASPRAVPK